MLKWDEWRGSNDGRPSMFIKHLVAWRGWRIDLHKFVRADDPNCYHTHPAKALRFILWGGYHEAVLDMKFFTGTVANVVEWKPLRAGIIKPELCHRIYALRNGKSSWSLWLRWPKTHEIQIVGEC